MKSTIIWKNIKDGPPPTRDPVLMFIDGAAAIGWYGPWDQRWRLNNVYCNAPQWWAPVPRIEECEA